MSVPSMWEVGNDFCPNLIQQLLENFDSRNDETWNLVQYITNFIETADSLFLEVPSKAASNWRGEKVQIHMQKIREYDNHFNMMTS